MNVILWIIFGGLAGWIASLITGTDASIGLVGNIIVGVVGAFLGGWIADKLNATRGSYSKRPTTMAAFFWAVFGAVVLILAINLVF